jgi:MFS family permease
VSHSFGRSTYGLLVPAIEDDLGFSHAQSGVPSTAIYIAYVVGVLCVTAAAPRVEPITIMRTGLAVAALGLGLASLAQDLVLLALGIGIAGGAGAGIWLTAPVLATTHVAPHRRGMVIGLLSSTIGLSNIVLGVGTTGMRRATDNDLLWRPVLQIEVLFTLGLLGALILWARFEPTAKVAGGFSFARLQAIPAWRRTTVAYACVGAMSAGFGAFMLVALEEQGQMERSTTTVVFSLMGISGVMGAPIAGWISDQVGRRVVMVGSMTVLMSACLLVALGTGWPVALGAVLFGAAAGSFPALVATYVRDHANDRSFSAVMATMTILFSLLAALTPASIGALADATGDFRLPYLVLAALAATSLVLVRTLPNERVPSGV